MRRRKTQQQDTCIYCGGFGPVTRDHVPPKQFFVEPRPYNLITVPSCKDCNKGFETDDEYFCDVTTQRAEIASHPKVKEINARIARKLDRPQSGGLVNRIKSQIDVAEVKTPAGIILGRVPIMHVEHLRISRVSKRIVKGLFYHVYSKRLSHESHWVVAFNLEQFHVQEARDILVPLSPVPVEDLLKNLYGKERVIIGEDEFAYSYVSVGDDPDASAWLFTFFGGSPFFGLTYPKALGGEIKVW